MKPLCDPAMYILNVKNYIQYIITTNVDEPKCFVPFFFFKMVTTSNIINLVQIKGTFFWGKINLHILERLKLIISWENKRESYGLVWFFSVEQCGEFWIQPGPKKCK